MSSEWDATHNDRKNRKWRKRQEVVIKAQQRGETRCLVDLRRQRPLYIDRNGPQWCVRNVTGLKVLSSSCLASKQLLLKHNLHLPTTCVSLLALCWSISEESNKRNTDRKLSEALSCKPRHLFLWKSFYPSLVAVTFPLITFLPSAQGTLSVLQYHQGGAIWLLVCIWPWPWQGAAKLANFISFQFSSFLWPCL